MTADKPILFTIISLACLFGMTETAVGQTSETTSQSDFDQEYFLRFNPTTAFDMVELVPGFQLREGDSDVRGITGASGNVLIDGKYPTSKQETLETLLKRIPASRVSKVAIIRSATSGYEMRGYQTIVDVELAQSSTVQGSVEAEYSKFRHGYDAPSLEGQLSFGSNGRSIDVSASTYREIDDEHGFGTRSRYYPISDTASLAIYSQPESSEIQRLGLNYLQPLGKGTFTLSGLAQQKKKFADSLELFPLDPLAGESGFERSREVSTEISMAYEHPLGKDRKFEIALLQNLSNETAKDQSQEVDEMSTNFEQADTSETILKTTFRQTGAKLSIETGFEAAVNILESETALEENGVAVELPAANVRVQEDRAEVFLRATWDVSDRVAVEAGGSFEYSELSQSGDNNLSKSLKFFKPRVTVDFGLNEKTRLGLLAERKVGQLDFGDFVSSPSVSTGDITAGNIDLEPESLWRLELSAERSIGVGAIRVTARHEEISDVVDHIAVISSGGTYDAIGNLGDGTRDELEINLSLPLEALGIRNATFQTDAILRKSSVDDVGGNGRRPISDTVPSEVKFSFSKFIPDWKTSFGAELTLAEVETTFEIDEKKTERIGERLEAFVEYTPNDEWTMRAFVKNITDSPASRMRVKYEGLRGMSSRKLIEERSLRSGPSIGFKIARAFN